MLLIAPGLVLGEAEIDERFVRAAGPGGQNVNKVATAVLLRFDVARSPSLSDDVRARLLQLARNRINKDGVLVIQAQRLRTREGNRRDARSRLVAWVQRALERPVPRVATRPSMGEKKRRLVDKRRRGQTKERRREASYDE